MLPHAQMPPAFLHIARDVSEPSLHLCRSEACRKRRRLCSRKGIILHVMTLRNEDSPTCHDHHHDEHNGNDNRGHDDDDHDDDDDDEDDITQHYLMIAYDAHKVRQ